MNKYLRLLFSVVIGFLTPLIAFAVNFSNPANGFLVDLRAFGLDNTFAGLLLFLINLALGIVGTLAIAFIIYGGFQYITSRGDEEQASAGKKTLTNAIIGLVIVILSYTIVTVIYSALNNRV